MGNEKNKTQQRRYRRQIKELVDLFFKGGFESLQNWAGSIVKREYRRLEDAVERSAHFRRSAPSPEDVLRKPIALLRGLFSDQRVKGYCQLRKWNAYALKTKLCETLKSEINGIYGNAYTREFGNYGAIRARADRFQAAENYRNAPKR